LVEEGKKRTVNFSTSRLPHPSSLGVLALAEATGAKFKLVPYGGGNAARSAAITGEVDACATFMSSSFKFVDHIKFLTVVANKNRMPDLTGNAPVVTTVFGTKIPEMTGNRAWAVQTKSDPTVSERYEILKRRPKKRSRIRPIARSREDEDAVGVRRFCGRGGLHAVGKK
jgi:hypothetical protein